MSYELTADGGTESLRVRIYALDGTCVASHAERYETKFLSGARAEQNAEDWWFSLVKATNICLKTIAKQIHTGNDNTKNSTVCNGFSNERIIHEGQSMHSETYMRDIL